MTSRSEIQIAEQDYVDLLRRWIGRHLRDNDDPHYPFALLRGILEDRDTQPVTKRR